MNQSDYKVRVYSDHDFELWNDFVAKAKNATFLFHRHFMEYHKDRFEDFSLLIFKNDKLVALLPANRKDDVLYSHQGLTYGGLVYKERLKFSEVLSVFKLLLQYIESKRVKVLHIKLLPSIYTAVPNQELDYLMFNIAASLTRRDTLSVINYNSNRLKISKIRDRGVKKAKKLALSIKEENVFDEFWDLILMPNLKQRYKTTPVHTLKEITYLKDKFPENIRQFNVYDDGRIVAGATIFETKNVAHAQYISANDERQETGALDYLFNYLVFEVFKSKSYFDFGISNENQGNNINEGLLYWKESFGARMITTDFYNVDTKNYKLLDNVML